MFSLSIRKIIRLLCNFCCDLLRVSIWSTICPFIWSRQIEMGPIVGASSLVLPVRFKRSKPFEYDEGFDRTPLSRIVTAISTLTGAASVPRVSVRSLVERQGAKSLANDQIEALWLWKQFSAAIRPKPLICVRRSSQTTGRSDKFARRWCKEAELRLLRL